MTTQKTCPVCEHWNNIIAGKDIKDLEEVNRSAARVKLSTHQYFCHFKEPAQQEVKK